MGLNAELDLSHIEALEALGKAGEPGEWINFTFVVALRNTAPSLLAMAREAIAAREFLSWSSQIVWDKNLSVTDAFEAYRKLVEAHDGR